MVEKMQLWDTLHKEVTINFYKPLNKTSNSAVIIFPGGGYWGRAEHEGKSYAEFLNDNGITAFVVDYRVHPNRFPLQLLDARRSVRFVRFYADKFGIDKEKIAVMGSSAGGHLASMLSTYCEKINGENVDDIDNEDFLPNKQILCYPVINLYDENITHIGSGDALVGDELKMGGDIAMRRMLSSELNVNKQTPEAFIWHTFDDNVVHVENTLRYAAALRKAEVGCEVHIFPHGMHGLGLADEDRRNEPHVAQWGNLLINWITDYLGW